jgi:hypothetical protein
MKRSDEIFGANSAPLFDVDQLILEAVPARAPVGRDEELLRHGLVDRRRRARA